MRKKWLGIAAVMFLAACGGACGGSSGADGGGGDVGAKICTSTADCGGTGICRAMACGEATGTCSQIACVPEPVCGCDGVTYPTCNEALSAGNLAYTVGACDGGPG